MLPSEFRTAVPCEVTPTTALVTRVVPTSLRISVACDTVTGVFTEVVVASSAAVGVIPMVRTALAVWPAASVTVYGTESVPE